MKYLIILILLTSCMVKQTVLYKYNYGNKVRINTGFYVNQIGTIVAPVIINEYVAAENLPGYRLDMFDNEIEQHVFLETELELVK